MKLRPRIRLRTLFAIIALAAVVFSWAVNRRNLIGRRHDFISAELAERQRRFSEPLGWNVASYDCQAPWTLRLFGEQGSKTIVVLTDRYFGNYTEHDVGRVREAKQLFPEAKVIMIRRLDLGIVRAEHIDDAPEASP